MDELLGTHIDDELFELYLEDWPRILANRVAVASVVIGEIPGVEGLLLAGSNGIGNPWPLSDIDFIPIYNSADLEAIREEVERVRLKLIDAWAHEGWRTGVDIGGLFFTVQELETSFGNADPDPVIQAEDIRWYHSIDKGYRSQVLKECGGYCERLALWLTSSRFRDDVIVNRIRTTAEECRNTLSLMKQALNSGDRISAYAALLKSIQWFQVHHMEKWRARDNSQGRFGTRFEKLAVQKGLGNVVADLYHLSSLSKSEVNERMSQSPWWVKERRDRSWPARINTGEDVSRLQNDRDVLRVCASYQLRLVKTPPFADWLAIPAVEEINGKGMELEDMLESFIPASRDF